MLSDRMVAYLFSFFPEIEHCVARRSCKQWNRVGNQDISWFSGSRTAVVQIKDVVETYRSWCCWKYYRISSSFFINMTWLQELVIDGDVCHGGLQLPPNLRKLSYTTAVVTLKQDEIVGGWPRCLVMWPWSTVPRHLQQLKITLGLDGLHTSMVHLPLLPELTHLSLECGKTTGKYVAVDANWWESAGGKVLQRDDLLPKRLPKLRCFRLDPAIYTFVDNFSFFIRQVPSLECSAHHMHRLSWRTKYQKVLAIPHDKISENEATRWWLEASCRVWAYAGVLCNSYNAPHVSHIRVKDLAELRAKFNATDPDPDVDKRIVISL
jgi:hypothetical protein